MTSTLPLIARSLQFAYSEAEDRLSLLASDAERRVVHVALTRRLTNSLVNGLANLLEQSSPLATTAPADLRDDIILLEHQDALYGETQVPSPVAVAGGEETRLNVPAPRLVQAVDVNITPRTFELLFRAGPSPLIRLSLTRLEVHRVIENLSQRAQAAGWNMSVESAWMEPGQMEIVFN
ncbi:hypothetical protein [Methylobacterium soli]|uniref:Uncharacterized protein n=1 Tax=Methylobacterium soli TaxID=553447 RepID=A0A6L3SQ09_9HYPH|nr:hypothetical protein [Methylobacterium soli]KAB1072886.1 hypothetical protein F6X53_27685 [Methylobacterium soli]GJE41351.1 hypothetical protein AEGHOMDF_0515 [Methylobacterium soli]